MRYNLLIQIDSKYSGEKLVFGKTKHPVLNLYLENPDPKTVDFFQLFTGRGLHHHHPHPAGDRMESGHVIFP
jgi:hypothetical protein